MIVKDPDAMTFRQKENYNVSETTGDRSHPIQLFSIIYLGLSFVKRCNSGI
jgi:hypothetical protein